MRRFLAALTASVLVGACATVPSDPAQSVFTAKLTFLGAVEIATSYARLPRCPQAAGACSDQVTVGRVNLAAHTAQVALNTAQQFSSEGEASSRASTAVDAVVSLVNLIQTLKVQP